jgi:bacterioferritin-associated ferredoxin
MPLKPDDIVCFCFHVNYQKVETFCHVQKPKAASEISECLSAGTGCGWCVPMLRKIHTRICGSYAPWWRQQPDAPAEANRADEAVDAEAYRAGRKAYIAEGKGTPAPGAEE